MVERDEELEEILSRVAKRMARRLAKREDVVVVRSLDELHKLVRSNDVVVLLITTPICPACRIYKPVFFEVARKLGGKAVFVHLNAYDAPEVADTLEVYAVPTTVIFKDGRVFNKILGIVSPEDLEEAVMEALDSG